MAEKKSKSVSSIFSKGKQLSRKLKLSEIQELGMCLIIVKRELEPHAIDVVKDNRGIVLSRQRGKGVSRTGIMSSIGAGLTDVVVIWAMARVEEIYDLVNEIGRVLDLEKPGNGKAMVIDVDGYMGAKAPFID